MQVSFSDLIAGALAGKLVSFPTDTVPALATTPQASDRIFAAKQRSRTKPLILMAAAPEDLWDYTSGSDRDRRIWQAIATRYWPGSLTLVLPASDRIPPAMNAIDPTTIGVRVPNSAIARQILAETGPLATTSANRSGEPPLLTLPDIEAAFPDVLIPTLPEVTHPEPGMPSTVVKWTQTGWEILRQGELLFEGETP
jgi:L-threonylcarbamoyladenylate synthase